MFRAILMSMLVMLTGCASGPVLQNQSMAHGFTALQHRNLAWTDPKARVSFQQMKEVGANAVVLVPFLEQDGAQSLDVRYSDAVTKAQLVAAIRYAHQYRMQVTVKPQMLVPGSWAGEIDHHDQAGWSAWFSSYSRQIVECARLAQREGVHAFVIGTELNRAAGRVDWPALIGQVRQVFHGRVTYAAQNVEGVKDFAYWSMLDAVSVTLYPALGSGDRDEMVTRANRAADALQDTAAGYKRPIWVLEVGMPSARGASEHPWQWQGLEHARVDLEVQSDAIETWLQVLDKPWVDALYIWAWYSDSRAGGYRDADYTPQNKPAEQVIAHFWGNRG